MPAAAGAAGSSGGGQQAADIAPAKSATNALMMAILRGSYDTDMSETDALAASWKAARILH